MIGHITKDIKKNIKTNANIFCLNIGSLIHPCIKLSSSSMTHNKIYILSNILSNIYYNRVIYINQEGARGEINKLEPMNII